MVVLAFGLSFTAAAQCGTESLLKGCVGACGMSYIDSYTVTAADVGPGGVGYFCLSATSNSLCPSHNAEAKLAVNGNGVDGGNLNLGDVLWAKAEVGDVLTVVVDAVFVDPNINCIWFGETEFALMK